MGETPRVTVIVPIRNRRILVRQLFDALTSQTFRSFEVIVVDDGSTDGAPNEVHAAQRRGLPVRMVRNRGSGAVEARRTGVAESCAPFLAFTDSDCIPTPTWLASAVGALESGADLVHGPTRPLRDIGLFERSTASGHEGLYPTSNVFYRRSAYDAAGGFDTTAGDRLGFRLGRRARGLGFGEDTLLAWAVARKGTVQFVDDAAVHHHVFAPDLIDVASRILMMGAFPALVREVPELRRTTLMRNRVFLGTRARALLHAAALAAIAGNKKVAVTGLVLWTLARATDGQTVRPARRALAALAEKMTTDVATEAVLVAGSLRARTVVL